MTGKLEFAPAESADTQTVF